MNYNIKTGLKKNSIKFIKDNMINNMLRIVIMGRQKRRIKIIN